MNIATARYYYENALEHAWQPKIKNIGGVELSDLLDKQICTNTGCY